MARKKKEVYHVKPLTEGKKNIISALIDEYDIESAEDIQDALRDLLGGTIKSMMEAEISVNVPKDRNGTFEPQVVKNRQKDISSIDVTIIGMYARGLTTRQISDQIEDWQTRPLDSVYPIVFIDAVHFSVRDNGIVRKLAAYVMLGINCDGEKDIISLSIGENESAKYWLGVLNELKNRGVQDIMVICADGLMGIKEAISTAFPKTEYQRCIVHMVRNTQNTYPTRIRKPLLQI